MTLVVSDTSPLRALAGIDAVGWLNELFGQIVIPPAVVNELSHPPGNLPSIDVKVWPWMILRTPHNAERVQQLLTHLDLGEAEAIALAEECRAGWLLMDELAGRGVAAGLGLPVMGTLGVILRARERRLCTHIRPLLDRLQNEVRFFVAPRLRQQILEYVGEE